MLILIFHENSPIQIHYNTTKNVMTQVNFGWNGLKCWHNLSKGVGYVVSKLEPIPSYEVLSVQLYLDRAGFKENKNWQFLAILLLSPRVNQMCYRKSTIIWWKLRTSAFSRWLRTFCNSFFWFTRGDQNILILLKLLVQRLYDSEHI